MSVGSQRYKKFPKEKNNALNVGAPSKAPACILWNYASQGQTKSAPTFGNIIRGYSVFEGFMSYAPIARVKPQ